MRHADDEMVGLHSGQPFDSVCRCRKMFQNLHAENDIAVDVEVIDAAMGEIRARESAPGSIERRVVDVVTLVVKIDAGMRF